MESGHKKGIKQEVRMASAVGRHTDILESLIWGDFKSRPPPLCTTVELVILPHSIYFPFIPTWFWSSALSLRFIVFFNIIDFEMTVFPQYRGLSCVCLSPISVQNGRDWRNSWIFFLSLVQWLCKKKTMSVSKIYFLMKYNFVSQGGEIGKTGAVIAH